LLLLVLLTLLPVLLLGIVEAQERRRQAIEAARSDALDLAHAAAYQHQDLVDATHQLLIALSHLPEIRQAESAACNQLLADMAEHYPAYANLTVYAPDGTVRCNSVSTERSVNSADRAWFQKAVQEQGWVLGGYQIGRISGVPSLVIGLPVLDSNGQVAVVLAASLKLDWLNRLAAESRLPPGSSFWLVDGDGVILSHFPETPGAVGRVIRESRLFEMMSVSSPTGTVAQGEVDGEALLLGLTRLQAESDGGQIFLAIGIPIADAVRNANRVSHLYLGALALMLFLALVTAWASGRIFFLRQFESLLDATHRLRSSDLRVRAAVASGAGELGQLAQAFNRMADELERGQSELVQLNKELDLRVQRRTAQLEATNQDLEAEVRERRRIEVALRARESQWRLLFEQANDAIFVVNENDDILDANQRACEMLGYTRDELLALKVPDVQNPETRGRTGEVVRSELTSGRIQDATDLRKDGTLIPVEISTRRIIGPPDGLALVIVRDITTRKRADEEIRTALAKERDLSELRARFVATTSHEFRTPLSTILTSAQLLELHGAGFSPDKRKAYLQRIQAAVQHMAGLLDNILAIAKVEAGMARTRLEQLDPVEFCMQLVEEIQLTGKTGHSIHLNVTGIPRPMCLDDNLLRQILTNLLSNAIKYSPSGSQVQFDLVFGDHEAVFRIRDHGIGIPLQEQNHIGEMFYRASNAAEYAGSGLGVAIVKRSVSLHNGTLALESTPGIGTIVTVRLPTG
jgi:PAS domain S-box-containing protein